MSPSIFDKGLEFNKGVMKDFKNRLKPFGETQKIEIIDWSM